MLPPHTPTSQRRNPERTPRLVYKGLSAYPGASSILRLSCKSGEKESRRADLRTADLLQLRVISQALQGFAGGCKTRISRGVSFPCLAACCTVLRSRWYQSGIKRGIAVPHYLARL